MSLRYHSLYGMFLIVDLFITVNTLFFRHLPQLTGNEPKWTNCNEQRTKKYLSWKLRRDSLLEKCKKLILTGFFCLIDMHLSICPLGIDV